MIVHLLIALAELALAAMIFHQALVADDNGGRSCAVRHWLLGMSIGLMGVGRFTSFLEGSTGPLVYTLAHVCFVGFGVAFWLSSRRRHGTAREMYERKTVRSLHAGRDDALANRYKAQAE